METEKSLVKKENPPSFIEKLMLNVDSLEEVKKVGEVIIASGFCPDHFKQSKDAVGVIMCIEAGRQLGLTWMQSLSDIYPVKGRTGIMGSAARSLIFSSGVLDKWEETTEGNYPDDSYKHIVISKRKGLPGEFRTEFSVIDAKKAGLFNKDIYQRYGKRMLMWRAIGFHANDYYGDIMKGMKTVEELGDLDVIPGIGDTTIEKEDGTKINIKAGGKDRSSKITDRVVDKIPENKFGEVNKGQVQDAVIIPEQTKTEEAQYAAQRGSVETFQGKTTERDGQGNIINQEGEKGASEDNSGQLTIEVMSKMETRDLQEIINKDTELIEACELIGGKNTNKKLREVIDMYQRGVLTSFVADLLKKQNDAQPQSQNTQEPGGAQGGVQSGEIPINKDFDNQGPAQPNVETGNKYGISVPEPDKGQSRDFSLMKGLFNAMQGITPPVNNPRYLELAGKLRLLQTYPDREAFCKNATVIEINQLLNAN